ncbi:hypothetical protein Tco_1270660 [Tanacetum coccineum]
MITYLKNMDGWKHKDLKSKDFDSIKELFDKAFKRVKMFVNYRTNLVEGLWITNASYIIVWKIHKEGKKNYYQIIRADGSSKIPVEDLDMILWGDLKTMFESHVEDRVWWNQQDYRVLDWKLYDSCGLHSLRMQHMHIHMLVEKRYPLTSAKITDMLNKKLQCDHVGRIVGIKSFLMLFGVTTVLIDVNATQSKLVLLENFNENYLIVTPHQGGNARRDEKGNHHNTLTSI